MRAIPEKQIRFTKIGFFVFISLSLILLQACFPSLPRPQTGRISLTKKPQHVAAAAYQVASDTLQYRFGPGDVLSIYVHDEPDISRDNISVRYDGNISF